GEPVYSEAVPSSEIAEAERVLGLAKQRFQGMEAVELESVTLGWRPLPIDGHPVIGFPKSAPGVYLMVTHSGFTLAAILAQFAAIEILNGAEVDMLAPFRVERFQ
ncbi:MAG: glycine/D-amino acid oxidase-like deaminating enzyme, partial [Myxococcota bacterium]